MFSFFDYVRRRTCDAVLAGLYDACDLIEAQNANESGPMAELLPGPFAGPAELKPVDPPPAPGERPPTPPRPAPGPPGQRPNSPQGGPSIPRFPQPPAPQGGDSEARKRGRPPKSPEAPQRSGRLTENPITGVDVCRLVKRRLKAAQLPTHLSPHSFRVAVATDLLKQAVPLEDVQYLLGHSDSRTTQLYDRRTRQVSRNIVERIGV